ncbi:MAG TPA: DUF2249 domain-containing protein [Mycobacteriales bacterium]
MEAELDVRTVPKAERHPLIFARFADLAPGESFVLVNTHEPVHLREEFERDQPGTYDWESHRAAPREWRIRITRRTAPLPQILCDTGTLVSRSEPDDPAGAVWRLEMSHRQLDANVVCLRPDERISAHAEPRLDVLLHVLGGAGTLTTEVGSHDVHAGSLVWLPHGSRREVAAGPAGLTYLTVHTRRPGLSIQPAPPSIAAG